MILYGDIDDPDKRLVLEFVEKIVKDTLDQCGVLTAFEVDSRRELLGDIESAVGRYARANGDNEPHYIRKVKNLDIGNDRSIIIHPFAFDVFYDNDGFPSFKLLIGSTDTRFPNKLAKYLNALQEFVTILNCHPNVRKIWIESITTNGSEDTEDGFTVYDETYTVHFGILLTTIGDGFTRLEDERDNKNK